MINHWLILSIHVLQWTFIWGFTPYGTDNGFDVGGNESVCLISELGAADITVDSSGLASSSELDQLQALLGDMISTENNDDNDIAEAATQVVQSLDKALFATKVKPAARSLVLDLEREKVELLDSCYDGTWVKVNALDLEPDSSMFRSFPYKFQINLRINITAVAGEGWSSNAGLFVRFVLCDALDRGFCNPVLDSPADDNSTVAIVSNSTSRSLGAFVDLKGKTIMSSWALPQDTVVLNSTAMRVNNLGLSFRIPRETPRGVYRLVFHTMLVLVGNNSTTVKRLDTATLSDFPIVNILDEPEILEMSKGVQIFLVSLIAVYDALILLILGYLFHFRKHPAIKLAQGPFLIALVVAALIGGTFTFTFMPIEDVFCILRGPLVLLPFTFIGSILVARLWRVYVTLSGAMKLGRSASADRSSSGKSLRSVRLSQLTNSISGWNVLQRLVGLLSAVATFRPSAKMCRRSGRSSGRPPTHFRASATGVESAQLVSFLVLPQLVVQVVGTCIYTPSLELEIDDVKRTGRYFCARDWDWVQVTGLFYCSSVFLLAVLLAWQGRELPSMFNEKTAIFNIASISTLVIVINVVILELTDNSTTSPDTSVFLRTISFLGIATLIVANLVLPKIKRAIKGDKVVVGNLLKAYENPEDSMASRGSSGPIQGNRASVIMSGAPIILRKDEPLPRTIEVQVHQIHLLFRGIGDKCASGIGISKFEWEQMNRSVARLKTDLDRVTLEWPKESEDHGSNGNRASTEESLNDQRSSQMLHPPSPSSSSCLFPDYQNNHRGNKDWEEPSSHEYPIDETSDTPPPASLLPGMNIPEMDSADDIQVLSNFEDGQSCQQQHDINHEEEEVKKYVPKDNEEVEKADIDRDAPEKDDKEEAAKAVVESKIQVTFASSGEGRFDPTSKTFKP